MCRPETDELLFERLRAKDESALEQVYDSHVRRALGLAYKLLEDNGAAEDVVQESFLSLWRHSHRLDSKKGRLEPLLLAIVHHKAIDQLRRQKLRRTVAVSPLTWMSFSAEEDTAEVAIQRMEAGAVRLAVASLPPAQRLTLQLAYFGGQSHTAIARATHTPLGTVKSRLRLALKHLQDLLRQ
jgi:RNA polymerase sigma-70 factor (ECF subfamily)